MAHWWLIGALWWRIGGSLGHFGGSLPDDVPDIFLTRCDLPGNPQVSAKTPGRCGTARPFSGKRPPTARRLPNSHPAENRPIRIRAERSPPALLRPAAWPSPYSLSQSGYPVRSRMFPESDPPPAAISGLWPP